jgi:hypothetical protein
LKKIKESIVQQNELRKSQQEDFNLENLQQLWHNYTEMHPLESVRTMLNQCILELEDKRITAHVAKPVSKDMLIQEFKLIDNIRDNFHMSDIIVDVMISPEKFPDVEIIDQNKNLTSREILKLLHQKNPAVKLAVDKLKLHIEDSAID